MLAGLKTRPDANVFKLHHYQSMGYLDEELRSARGCPTMRFRLTYSLAALLCAVSLFAQPPAKRLLTADDVYRTKYVQDIQVSPEGTWISYTLTTVDRKADKRSNAVWMVNWNGTQDIPLTAASSSDSTISSISRLLSGDQR